MQDLAKWVPLFVVAILALLIWQMFFNKKDATANTNTTTTTA